MRFPKVFTRLSPQPHSISLTKYKVGQRTVELLQLADGHVHWVCNCDDYNVSAVSPMGAWCKHVAKASAIRSIERLTGARVITRPAVPVRASERAPDTAPAAQPSRLGHGDIAPQPMH